MFIKKFYMPEDPRDGNGPIIMINGIGNTIVPGDDLGENGPGGIGDGGDNGNNGSNITPIFPLPTGSLTDCIEFATPQLMQASLVSFLTNRILYYKINLEQTQRNIYGEALEK